MQQFDDNLHKAIKSEDGTFTAFSQEYNEHYHSTKDGALNESLYKHIIPAFELSKGKGELHILDICYGLGFNTLATLYYHKQNNLGTKLFIYSPELDSQLVKNLRFFHYPQEFKFFTEIIEALSTKQFYQDENFTIEVFLGDAREYVKKFENRFDIVYQDAFSPSVNPVLWTQEYFSDIKKSMKENGVITTYSTALKTRLALYNNGFRVYLNEGENYRNATVASLAQLPLKEVDMQHKIKCNPTVEPLRD